MFTRLLGVSYNPVMTVTIIHAVAVSNDLLYAEAAEIYRILQRAAIP